MESFLPENEYKEFEGRRYLNPQLAVDEGNKFIDRLRSMQQDQNQQIATQTQNLGTNISTNLGGLTGANSYFTSRYQTPQTNSALANLRATAQASALNQALQNEQEMWKKRYQDAYRKYQKSAYDKANSGGGGGTSSSGENGEVDFQSTPETSFEIEGTVPGVAGGYTVANIVPDWDNPENSIVTGITGVPYGEDYKTNYTYNYAPKYKTVTGDLSLNPTYTKGLLNGELRFTLPSGSQVTINSWNEDLMKGTDGSYYVHNKDNNTYTYAGK